MVADDPSVAVWRLSLGCALLLGALTLLLWWRVRTLRAVSLPVLGALGCLAVAIAAWIQSLTFIQDVCATGLALSDETGQRVVERAQAAVHLNLVYQDLTVAAVALTLVLLVWGESGSHGPQGDLAPREVLGKLGDARARRAGVALATGWSRR